MGCGESGGGGVSIDYATLPRTPSGALTAASKRAIEAERLETMHRIHAENEKRRVRRELVAELVDASDALDAHEEDSEPVTDREKRIKSEAYEKGITDGAEQARDNADGVIYSLIHDAIHRIENLGLDTDLSALDVLKRMREVVGE